MVSGTPQQRKLSGWGETRVVDMNLQRNFATDVFFSDDTGHRHSVSKTPACFTFNQQQPSLYKIASTSVNNCSKPRWHCGSNNNISTNNSNSVNQQPSTSVLPHSNKPKQSNVSSSEQQHQRHQQNPIQQQQQHLYTDHKSTDTISASTANVSQHHSFHHNNRRSQNNNNINKTIPINRHKNSYQNNGIKNDSYPPLGDAITPNAIPAEGCVFDNDEHDYICYKYEIFPRPALGRQYVALKHCGKGAYGQVIQCAEQNLEGQTVRQVAIKIVKNQAAYLNQAVMEVRSLLRLSREFPQSEHLHVTRMFDHFIYRNHLFIVLHLLGENLFQVLQRRGFCSIPTLGIQHIIMQLFETLVLLESCRLLHCDLKPENIMIGYKVPCSQKFCIPPLKRDAAWLNLQRACIALLNRQNGSLPVASSSLNVNSSSSRNIIFNSYHFLQQPNDKNNNNNNNTIITSQLTPTSNPITTTTTTTTGTTTSSITTASSDSGSITSADCTNPSVLSKQCSFKLSSCPPLRARSWQQLPLPRNSYTYLKTLVNNFFPVTMIDFGSSCFETEAFMGYIQSRYYRAPEIILGLPHWYAIDVWSLGCICAELYVGVPLFAGEDEFDQLQRIIETVGQPPDFLLDCAKRTTTFFTAVDNPDGNNNCRGKSTSKNYGPSSAPASRWRLISPTTKRTQQLTRIRLKNLDELIDLVTYPDSMTLEEQQEEEQRRRCMVDFLKLALDPNPFTRLSSWQALTHPFVLRGFEIEFMGKTARQLNHLCRNRALSEEVAKRDVEETFQNSALTENILMSLDKLMPTAMETAVHNRIESLRRTALKSGLGVWERPPIEKIFLRRLLVEQQRILGLSASRAAAAAAAATSNQSSKLNTDETSDNPQKRRKLSGNNLSDPAQLKNGDSCSCSDRFNVFSSATTPNMPSAAAVASGVPCCPHCHGCTLAISTLATIIQTASRNRRLLPCTSRRQLKQQQQQRLAVTLRPHIQNGVASLVALRCPSRSLSVCIAELGADVVPSTSPTTSSKLLHSETSSFALSSSSSSPTTATTTTNEANDRSLRDIPPDDNTLQPPCSSTALEKCDDGVLSSHYRQQLRQYQEQCFRRQNQKALKTFSSCKPSLYLGQNLNDDLGNFLFSQLASPHTCFLGPRKDMSRTPGFQNINGLQNIVGGISNNGDDTIHNNVRADPHSPSYCYFPMRSAVDILKLLPIELCSQFSHSSTTTKEESQQWPCLMQQITLSSSTLHGTSNTTTPMLLHDSITTNTTNTNNNNNNQSSLSSSNNNTYNNNNNNFFPSITSPFSSNNNNNNNTAASTNNTIINSSSSPINNNHHLTSSLCSIHTSPFQNGLRRLNSQLQPVPEKSLVVPLEVPRASSEHSSLFKDFSLLQQRPLLQPHETFPQQSQHYSSFSTADENGSWSSINNSTTTTTLDGNTNGNNGHHYIHNYNNNNNNLFTSTSSLLSSWPANTSPKRDNIITSSHSNSFCFNKGETIPSSSSLGLQTATSTNFQEHSSFSYRSTALHFLQQLYAGITANHNNDQKLDNNNIVPNNNNNNNIEDIEQNNSKGSEFPLRRAGSICLAETFMESHKRQNFYSGATSYYLRQNNYSRDSVITQNHFYPNTSILPSPSFQSHDQSGVSFFGYAQDYEERTRHDRYLITPVSPQYLSVISSNDYDTATGDIDHNNNNGVSTVCDPLINGQQLVLAPSSSSSHNPSEAMSWILKKERIYPNFN